MLTNRFLLILTSIFLTGCTLNIVMTQSEDSTDAVDADPDTQVDPDIKLSPTFM